MKETADETTPDSNQRDCCTMQKATKQNNYQLRPQSSRQQLSTNMLQTTCFQMQLTAMLAKSFKELDQIIIGCRIMYRITAHIVQFHGTSVYIAFLSLHAFLYPLFPISFLPLFMSKFSVMCFPAAVALYLFTCQQFIFFSCIPQVKRI